MCGCVGRVARSLMLYFDYLLPYATFYGLTVAGLQAANLSFCTGTIVDDATGLTCMDTNTRYAVIFALAAFSAFLVLEVIALPRAPQLSFNAVAAVEQHKEHTLVRLLTWVKLAIGLATAAIFVYHLYVDDEWEDGTGAVTFLYTALAFGYSFANVATYEGYAWPGMAVPPADDFKLPAGRFGLHTSTYLMTEFHNVASLDPANFRAVDTYRKSKEGRHVDVHVARAMSERQYHLLRVLFGMEGGGRGGAGGGDGHKALLG